MRDMRFVCGLGIAIMLIPACNGNEHQVIVEESGSTAQVDPEDPCAFLSLAQVESAIGTNVSEKREVPSRDLETRICTYETSEPWSSVGVSMKTEVTPEDFQDLMKRDPRNSDTVEGIGEGAFIHGCSGINVHVDDLVVSLGVQHLTTCEETAEVLQALGTEAVEQLT